jgi:hypothetical protein
MSTKNVEITEAADAWIPDVIARLEREKIPHSLDPSNVSGSPYAYIFIWLTDREIEGPHLIISSGEEWGEQGILYGEFEDYEEPAVHAAENLTPSQALDRALLRAKKVA